MEHPLRTARKGQELSQPDLAERVGVHWTTISKIETRKRQPSISLARRLGRVLRTPWKQLVED